MQGEYHQRRREIQLAALRQRREAVLTVIRLLESYQRLAGPHPRTPAAGAGRRLRGHRAE